jgi:integrase
MLPTPPARPAPEGAGRTRAAQAYTLLHTVLGTALHDELIAANPCRIRGARKVTHTERVPATPAQVDQIAAAIPPRYAAAVRVAAWSGLRGGELFALRRADVDLDAGTLRVSRALVELTGQPLTYGPPKSEAGRRTVHLPRTIVDVLAQHLETFTETVPEALVFTTEAGGPVSRRVRGQHFAKARAAAGRPDLRWHDLRHTGAVLAASTGASIAELQHRLGHSTYAAAMNYQHASASRDAELADRLDLLLGGTGPHPSDPPSPPSPAPSPPGASTTGVARDTDATSDTDEKHTAATILPFAKRPTRSRRLG